MMLSIFSFSSNVEPSIVVIFVLLATILLTRGIIKQLNAAGCLSYGYISAIVFCVVLFATTAFSFLINLTTSTLHLLRNGKPYTATVVSYETYESYDKENNRYTTMYTPTVAFTDDQGNTVTKELGYSSSSVKLGDQHNIRYDAKTGAIIEMGFILIISFIGSGIFSIVFGAAFIACCLYAMGKPMTQFWSVIKIIGVYFFIPALMIGFEALMIYALFTTEITQTWAKILLIFFSIVLGLGILGYAKNMITNGIPKFRQVRPGKWTGDWQTSNKNKKKNPKPPKGINPHILK